MYMSTHMSYATRLLQPHGANTSHCARSYGLKAPKPAAAAAAEHGTLQGGNSAPCVDTRLAMCADMCMHVSPACASIRHGDARLISPMSTTHVYIHMSVPMSILRSIHMSIRVST